MTVLRAAQRIRDAKPGMPMIGSYLNVRTVASSLV